MIPRLRLPGSLHSFGTVRLGHVQRIGVLAGSDVTAVFGHDNGSRARVARCGRELPDCVGQR